MIGITGASGELGRRIVRSLLTQVNAEQIMTLVRSPEKVTEWHENGIQVRQGSYEDRESLAKAFMGVGTLMFISNTDFANRMEQHKNIVEMAQHAGVKQMVYTSFISAGTDEGMLGASHLATEQFIQASNIDHTILRPNFYMDGYVAEVQIAMSVGAYRSPTEGDIGASFVSRDDIARTAVALLTHPNHTGNIYRLTGSSVVTPNMIAKTASQISGKAVQHEQITWEQLTEDYKARGIPDAFVPMVVFVEKMVASNALAGVSDDITQLTGQPAEEFYSYAKRTLQG